MIAAFCLATAACTSPKKDAKNNAFSAAEEEAETIESEMPEEADSQDKQTTFTYGSHAYTMTGTLNAEAYDEKATGMVTFTIFLLTMTSSRLSIPSSWARLPMVPLL